MAQTMSHHTKPATTAPTPLCTTIVLPIKASANNTIYPPYPNSTAEGTYLQYLGSFNASTLPTHTVSGTFDISATYCEPSIKVRGREHTIQLLLHALANTKASLFFNVNRALVTNFNKEYWSGSDFPNLDFQGQYSWVSHATSQGYATLAIDRLGNGDSTRPDPLQVVQAPLEIAVTVEILNGLRAGSLPRISNKYSKIVVAGHSYGSILSRLIATYFPTTAADAYIFTAESVGETGLQNAVSDFKAVSASVASPRFADLPDGYLSVSKSGLRETSYGLPGQFDPRMLAWDQASPHIFAIGEIVGNTPTVASNFTGPVMAVVGQEDQIACGNGKILSQVPHCGVGPGSSADGMYTLFPKASNFGSFSPARTSHFIGNEYSASEVFGAVHAWLASVGF